jgi:hypothetical protein
VADDVGPKNWDVMVKTTKLNYEKTTLVVGAYKFNEIINLNLSWFYFLRHSEKEDSVFFLSVVVVVNQRAIIKRARER